MNYEQKKLGDYIDILSGFAFKSKDFVKKGIPIIKIKNITPPEVLLEDLTYVSEEVAEKQKKFLLGYDDVLIAMTGSHINQWASVVGRVARVKYYDKSLLNQRVGKVTLKEEVNADISYIYYYLSQDKVKIELAAKASGAANQANISPSDIKELLFPCPEIDIQIKIAGILRKYDDLIENSQKQIKLLEEAAQRLYKEWFVDLRFPGYEACKIVDGVPEGWEKRFVGDMLKKIPKTEQIKASEYMKSGSIPVIDQSKNFVAGYTNNQAALIEENLPIIVFGDHTRVLKYISFPFAKGADGTQLVLTNNIKRMPQALLYCSLINIDLSNYHYARHFKYLKAEEILVPIEEIAEQFNTVIQPIYELVQKKRDQCMRIAEARDRMLPKLMSGEIEV